MSHQKVSWRGRTMCSCGVASIEQRVEPELIKAGEIRESVEVQQGCYSGSVSASAGTHDGGGAIDTDRYDSTTALRIWREAGWAYWPRGYPYDSMDPHCHGILNGCPDLSPSAQDQLDDYHAGRNGLANNGKDPGPDVRPLPTWQEALADYQPEGIFTMTDQVYEKRDEPSGNLNPDGNWRDLSINDDGGYTVVGETDQATVSANVTFDGLAPGEWVELMWRIASYKEGTDTSYPYVRRPVRAWGRTPAAAPTEPVDVTLDDDDQVTLTVVYNGGVHVPDDDRSARLRLGYRTNAAAARVLGATIEGWSS